MRISVIIVSYNVREDLARCIASAQGAHEVIVVDNASRDDSVAYVRAHFPWVHLLAMPDNRGFSAAVNAGARQATGDALLLLNPDAELPADALARLPDTLASRPHAWAVGYRQVDEHGRFQLAVGPTPTLVGEFLRKIVQGRLDAGSHRMARLLDHLLRHPRPIPWVAGAAMLVWRHAFDRIGGFDENYFLYFEDVDFCLRLRRAGGHVYYDPSVTVMHRRGVSAATVACAARRAYRASQLYFWETHRGPWLGRCMHGYLRLRGQLP